MSEPQLAGDILREWIYDYARRHNRPEIIEAFEEGALIWTDNPHPRAWSSKHGSVKPGVFSKDRAAREAAIDAMYERDKTRI